MEHQIIRERALNEKKLVTASIEITEKCNLSCKHCYCHSQREDLAYNDIITIIDKLYDLGVFYLTFSGGEVFTHPDFGKIYLYAKRKGFIITILSNATLISNKMKEMLKKYKPELISISVYGIDEQEYIYFTGKNSYNKLKENLDFFKENQINFRLKTVLTKDSYQSAINHDYEKLANKYDTDMTYDPIIFGNKDRNNTSLNQRLTAKEIVNIEKTFSDSLGYWQPRISSCSSESCIKCGSGISSVSIDSKGIARICSLYIQDGIDFLSNKNEEIIHFLQQSHYQMQNNFTQSQCYKCNKKSICKWCSAYAYLEHQQPQNSIDFFCQLADERIKEFGYEYKTSHV